MDDRGEMDQPERPLEDRIRHTVAAGEFAEANALWVELGGRLRRESAAGPIPITRLRQTRELLAWCRTMALVGRAHCQRRLNQLAVSSCYLPQPAAPRQRLLARF
jgi:hypothetical protein